MCEEFENEGEKEMLLRCKKCDAEIGLLNKFSCTKCENIVKPTTIIDEKIVDENVIKRKRHGFTAFYLTISCVVYLISGLIYIFIPERVGGIAAVGLVRFHGFVAIAAAIGIDLIWRWKKIGFWVWLVSTFCSSLIITAGAMFFVFSVFIDILLGLIGLLISIAIMWGILHIRKGGKNVWEQLE